MLIGIVVLNWNGAKDTVACLKSISKLDFAHKKLFVVVVDNASTESIDAIENFPLTNLQIIRNSQNLGFTGGNNVGIKKILQRNVDFVLIINNDTLLDSSLLLELCRVFQKQKAGIISPKIYFAPGFEFHKKRYKKSELGHVLWYAGGIIDWKNVYGFNRGVDEVDNGQYDSEVEIDFATGACMFVHRRVFEKIGLFDTKYFMYFEDVDFSVRAKKEGERIVFAPNAVLRHKVGRSAGIGTNLTDYYLSRNRLLFGFKYAPLRSKLALIKESFSLLKNGRRWQKQGILDFYLQRFGKGSYRL